MTTPARRAWVERIGRHLWHTVQPLWLKERGFVPVGFSDLIDKALGEAYDAMDCADATNKDSEELCEAMGVLCELGSPEQEEQGGDLIDLSVPTRIRRLFADAHRQEDGYPLATGRDADGGWTLDPKFLDRIACLVRTEDEQPSMEAVEAILLAASKPAPAAPQGVRDMRRLEEVFDASHPLVQAEIENVVAQLEARTKAAERGEQGVRECLEPFAKLLHKHHENLPDEYPVFAINDAKITVGDLRKARASLEGGETMSEMRQTIRAVVFREGPWWVAQCLEYDIAAQAKSFEQLIHEIHRMLLGYSVIGTKEQIDIWGVKSKAPAVFWRLFNQHGKKAKFDSDPYTQFPNPRPRLVEVRTATRNVQP